jgi:glycerol dehydrogenase-like iron-containing ADH family enzyme
MAKREKPAIAGNACRIVCDYHYERRPFTAKDVGRIACKAMSDGVTLQEIRTAIVEKCGVGEVECDCEEVERELRKIQQAAELIIEIMLLAIPIVGVATKLLRTYRIAGAAKKAEDLQLVGKWLQDARTVAEANLSRTREILNKMAQEAKPIVIKE